MPCTKVPSTLYNLALTETRLWIVNTANEIHKEFGGLKNIQCKRIVFQLKKFLTSSVPAHIIDDLCNYPEILDSPEYLKQYKAQFPCDKNTTLDHRIVFSIYMHDNMRVLNTHKVVDDVFWKSTLRSLKNLSRLDLNKVCTDEILEIVGKNCINLKFVNISSKSCHPRARDRHNALKLQTCVSDVGLSCLANCKQLKEIQMTCIIRKGCGGRQVSNEGIKKLILSLPKLLRINYTDTGILLDSITEDIGHLSLVSLMDYHPNAARFSKMELLCPYLNELYLKNAFSSEDYRSEVIHALTHSRLKISVLSLTFYIFDDFLKTYLKTKGNHLRSFTFVSNITLSPTELFLFLGRTCLNLEKVHMNYMFERPYNDSDFRVNQIGNKELLFSNLKSLTVKGFNCDLIRLLPLVLNKATSIEKLTLSNHSSIQCLDSTFRDIQRTNQFLNLKTLQFLQGTDISHSFLLYFLMSCPIIKNIFIGTNSLLDFNHALHIKKQLLSKNFDVNIEVVLNA